MHALDEALPALRACLPPPLNVQEKINRLEELSWFQEKLLGELNEALTAQQRQLDRIEKRLAMIEERVRQLQQSCGQDAPVNTLPPHYMPERY